MNREQGTAGTEPNTDADVERQVDAEEAKGNAEMRKLGFDDAAIARARGRTVEDIAPKPKPTLGDVERELDELMEMRKTNKRKYYSEAVQKRGDELYALQAELKAQGAPAQEEGEGTAGDAGVADSDLPEALRQEWAKTGPDGIEGALAAIRSRTIIAFEGLEDGGERLRSSFDRDLDADAQNAIASSLAIDAGSKAPMASAQELQEFGDLPHGGPLVREWGANAAKMLGRARREAAHIESRLTEGSRLRLHRWIAGRSPAELSAAVRVLATRAQRRL
jgi:hypothetical protein